VELKMPAMPRQLTIGDVAKRCGIATSAIRYYESRGLIQSLRTGGNQRRYARAVIRRIAVIQAAQSVGLTLEEIAAALCKLPDGRTPAKQDWERLSKAWRERLDRQISDLERLRDQLSSCIGCGCLSLKSCALFNNDDRAAARGPGARYLLGDRPPR
jgi:MerR family redox-sensitive transcriptional activator SoxR